MRFTASGIKFWVTFGIAAAAVAGSGYRFFVLATRVADMRSVFGTIERQTAQLEREQEDARNFSRLAETRAKDLNRVRSFYIDGERPLEFIGKLEDLADALGNTIAVSADASSADAAGSADLGMRLKLVVGGTRASVLRYAAAVEHLPYDISIRTADLGPPPPDTARPSSTGRIVDTELALVIRVGIKTASASDTSGNTSN